MTGCVRQPGSRLRRMRIDDGGFTLGREPLIDFRAHRGNVDLIFVARAVEAPCLASKLSIAQVQTS